MDTILGTILAFTIVFGILVFVHELGHFVTAKLVGVRVEVFSFGYGKRLFGVRKGGTDYRVSLIPMGGYVKMLGEGMFEKDRPLAPDDLMAKPRWQRFLIMVMGAVMNIALAVVLVSVINMAGTTVPAYQDERPVIGWIDEGSPAASADLRPGDLITAVNGRNVGTWTDVELAVGSRPDRLVTVTVERDGRIVPVEFRTEEVTRFFIGYAGFRPRTHPELQMISPRSAAEAAGLRTGDVITAIDGEPVYYHQFVDAVSARPDSELRFTVRRGGLTLEIPVTPRRVSGAGVIGATLQPESVRKQYGFFKAVGESVRENARNVTLIFRFLRDLFTGEASTRHLGGPLEIANYSYAALRMGWLALTSWIALISLQLGVLNLLPIPVFDGGQIFVLALEGLTRRDLGPRARTIWMQIGFVIFVVLIAFVLLNDFVKRLPNGWSSLVPF